jgi:hypothetical protein
MHCITTVTYPRAWYFISLSAADGAGEDGSGAGEDGAGEDGAVDGEESTGA